MTNGPRNQAPSDDLDQDQMEQAEVPEAFQMGDLDEQPAGKRAPGTIQGNGDRGPGQ